MKYLAFSVALFLAHLSPTRADEPFTGEFQLKAKVSDVDVLMLAPTYHIRVVAGAATVQYSKDGIAFEAKGTVVLTIQEGIDAHKRPAKFAGSLRIEFNGPDENAPAGKNDAHFVTRIELPIELTEKAKKHPVSIDPESNYGFTPTAFADMLALDTYHGVPRYTDAFGIRMHVDYTVEVIKNPMR